MGLNVFLIDKERTFANALAARLEAEDDIDVVLAVHRQAPAPSLIVGRHARVVMLSRVSEASRIADAVRAGAAGWVRKGESLAYLLQVIRGVAEGETWLSPAETGAVLRLLMREEKQQRDSDRLLASLTPREREVLACLAEGAGRQDVAERLHLSANTVRTHLQNLMAKLGVHSTLEAVAVVRSQLSVVPSQLAEPANDRTEGMTSRSALGRQMLGPSRSGDALI